MRVHESDVYAEVDLGEPIMEFRLTYQGPLFASKSPDLERRSRRTHIHNIRRRIHEQLEELWRLDPRLRAFMDKNIHETDAALGVTTTYSRLDRFSEKFEKCGIKWAPLINDEWGVACILGILFLRHEPRGGIIQSGDLDNRIVTLFDALRIPDENQFPEDVLAQNEPNPFFCLMTNDKLIAEFRVTSDRLLVPSPKAEGDADVHLVIEVKTFIADHEKANKSIWGWIHQA